MSILIVDDDRDLARLLAIRLRTEGRYEVSVAESAQAALARLGIPEGETRTDIDLILLDVKLPDRGGIEVCRSIKNHPAGRDIPIIIITGYEGRENLEAAFDSGAVDYISKPFDKFNLMARIRSALGLKREADIHRRREQELLELAQQLEASNEQLRRLSFLDSLTGAANRRYFDIVIYREFQRALRHRSPLSLIMIDIDGFKRYNDIYGHRAGDSCLCQVSAALGSVLKRPNDLLARYGGEEFAVILPETDSAGAGALAESLRRAIENLKVSNRIASQDRVAITISLGVATRVPRYGDGYSRLVTAADKALYQSKRAGRNAVTVANL